MPKLHSYVVARDYGFAPNPFFGFCTLATCKPKIRERAAVNDWIIGTGSKQRDRRDSLVYAMRVTETMTFNEYWEDERFERKKPNLRGSLKQGYGDNIYFKDDTGWRQQDSHHSYSDSVPNKRNIRNDTQTDTILCSTEYAYWGGCGPEIPQKFKDPDGCDIRAKRGYKCRFPEEMVNVFVTWFRSLNVSGYLNDPLEWSTT